MHKVISHTNSVEVGTHEMPKNSCSIIADEVTKKVGISTVGGRPLITPVDFKEYKDSGNTPYTSYTTLITDLRAALFA
jgi:hypothetical protein